MYKKEDIMLHITATSLRGNIFSILKKVESGEQVVVTHNKRPVACLQPVIKKDWRDKITQKPTLCVPPDEILKPVEDTWEDLI